MSDYYNNRKKKRSRREKIGFYTACSICLIAVCMAVYSTYNTLSVPSAKTPVATQSNVGDIAQFTIELPLTDWSRFLTRLNNTNSVKIALRLYTD